MNDPHAAPAGQPTDLLDKLFAEPASRWRLANGLTVIHHEDDAHPLASLQLWMRTGSIHEGAHLGAGLSHYLEHMLFKGTARRPGQAAAAEAQRLGGQLNAYTAFDRTVLHIDIPAESFAAALDLIHDIACNPVIAEADVASEREVILREIDMALDDPDRLLSRALLATAFRVHPYRHPVIGQRERFLALTRADLQAYHAARYRPANMVLVVTGAIAGETLRANLEATFATLPGDPVADIAIAREPEQLAYREQHLHGDFQVCRGALGFRVPSLRHRDSPALDLLAAILGSGQSARLRRRLRDDLRLVHDIDASVWNPGDDGLFWINYVCEPGRSAAARNAILGELDSIAAAGVSQAELDKARRFALVAEMHARQTVAGLAARLGLAEAIVGDSDWPRQYFRHLARLRPEDFSRLCARYLDQGRLSAVTLEPAAAAPAARPARRAAPPLADFMLHTLANGARILLQPDHRLPRVHIRYTGLGGGLYEHTAERGITALMTNLCTRDTRFRRERAVADELENRGGFMFERAGNNTFTIGVEVLPCDIDCGLRTLEEAILFPAFRDDTVAREREVQVARIQEACDDIVEYGNKSLRRNFFGTHPFAIDADGEIHLVRELQPAALRCQRDRLMVAPNAVLAVAGDFAPDRLLQDLECFLLELPATAFRPVDKPFAGPPQTGELSDFQEREQAVVFEAYPDVGTLGDDKLAGEALHAILNDMAGPLFARVREDNGLAYFVCATRLLGLRFGMFAIYAGTRPDVVDQVYAAISTELDRLRDGGPDPDALASACRSLKVGLRMQRQNPGLRALHASLNLLFGKPVEEWKTYDARLDALTPDDIATFARTQLDPSRRMRLTVRPPAGIPTSL
jgi:zinc protease